MYGFISRLPFNLTRGAGVPWKKTSVWILSFVHASLNGVAVVVCAANDPGMSQSDLGFPLTPNRPIFCS